MDKATPAARFWAEFRESHIATAALFLILVIAVLALLAPWVAPQNPYDIGKLVLMDLRAPASQAGLQIPLD